MQITLPPELEANLRAIATRQGKDLVTIVIEVLTQSLALNQPRNSIIPKQPRFMRFAGIAARETALLVSLEEDVNRDRALDLQRQIDL